MVKKIGVVNSKAEAAKARKSAIEADRAAREAREKEDQFWREAEGSKSRAAKKREEEAEKRAEAAAKKAEARRLAELEQKDLEESAKKKANRVFMYVPKVTEAELMRRKEVEQAALRRIAEEERKRAMRIADEEEYERMVRVANVNRDDSVIEARTVEGALAHLTVADSLPVDKHPEKRRKALFKAFEEAELPSIKAEKPGLTHTQYKDMVWKLWKKWPDNPENKVKSTFKSKSGPTICGRLDDDTMLKIELQNYVQEIELQDYVQEIELEEC